MLDHFEIRPAVDFGEDIQSFLGEPVWCATRGTHVCTPEGAEAEARAAMANGGKSLFWTLYMRDTDGTAQALGDFKDFDAAFEVQSTILAPMRLAADAHGDSTLEDICNQSSLPDRL